MASRDELLILEHVQLAEARAAAGLISLSSSVSAALATKADDATTTTALAGKVPTTRSISTTSPLSGGGDLSANRTLSIDLSAYVQNIRSIATTGPLSGGGDLSANRTLTTSVATNKLIGRYSSGTGIMEEIAPSDSFDMSTGTLKFASSTWASRGSGTFAGQLKRITDVGPAPGTFFIWDAVSGYWKPLQPYYHSIDTTLSAGASSTTAEQFLKQVTLPTGILRGVRIMEVEVGASKVGTGNAMNLNVRIGTTGTATDVTCVNINSVASNVRYGYTHRLAPNGSNTLAFAGSQTTSVGENAGSGSAFPSDITLAGSDTLDSALIISFTLAAVTSADTVSARRLHIKMWP